MASFVDSVCCTKRLGVGSSGIVGRYTIATEAAHSSLITRCEFRKYISRYLNMGVSGNSELVGSRAHFTARFPKPIILYPVDSGERLRGGVSTTGEISQCSRFTKYTNFNGNKVTAARAISNNDTTSLLLSHIYELLLFLAHNWIYRRIQRMSSWRGFCSCIRWVVRNHELYMKYLRNLGLPSISQVLSCS